MDLVDLPVDQLQSAPWNPNQMDRAMARRLMESLGRYGLVHNLVVRPDGADGFEVLSGNQRLEALKELGCTHAPCLVVNLGDAEARLLAQAINRIQGEDDLGLQADLLREVLESISEEEVLSILPESADSLKAIATLGQQDMATYLEEWQRSQGARLKHLQLQLTSAQLQVVEEALSRFLPMAREIQEELGSPNARGTALYLLCQAYLDQKSGPLP